MLCQRGVGIRQLFSLQREHDPHPTPGDVVDMNKKLISYEEARMQEIWKHSSIIRYYNGQ